MKTFATTIVLTDSSPSLLPLCVGHLPRTPPPPNPHNLGPIVREGMTGTRDFAGKMITENWSMYSQIQRVLPPATPMGNYCPPTLRQKGKESSSCLRQAERTADMPRLSCALSCRTHLVDCLLSRAGAGEAGPTGTCI